jgi:hypothetical protein
MASIRSVFALLLEAGALAGIALSPGGLVTPARADGGPSAEGEVAFVNASQNRVRYSFSAEAADQGRVEGEVVFHVDRADGHVLDARGTATCVTVAGNVARIGAKLERLTQDGQEVTGFVDMYFTVVDNGEADEDGTAVGLTDLASNMFFGLPQPPSSPARSVQHCMTGFPHPLFPIQHGEVEVRQGEVEAQP